MKYCSKQAILECYDAMIEVINTGRPYQTIDDPPPADSRTYKSDKSYIPLETIHKENENALWKSLVAIK